MEQWAAQSTLHHPPQRELPFRIQAYTLTAYSGMRPDQLPVRHVLEQFRHPGAVEYLCRTELIRPPGRFQDHNFPEKIPERQVQVEVCRLRQNAPPSGHLEDWLPLPNLLPEWKPTKHN